LMPRPSRSYSIRSAEVTNAAASELEITNRSGFLSCRTLTCPNASRTPESARIQFAATRSSIKADLRGPTETADRWVEWTRLRQTRVRRDPGPAARRGTIPDLRRRHGTAGCLRDVAERSWQLSAYARGGAGVRPYEATASKGVPNYPCPKVRIFRDNQRAVFRDFGDFSINVWILICL